MAVQIVDVRPRSRASGALVFEILVDVDGARRSFDITLEGRQPGLSLGGVSPAAAWSTLCAAVEPWDLERAATVLAARVALGQRPTLPVARPDDATDARPVPPAALRRFERVRVTRPTAAHEGLRDATGTVIWSDPHWFHRARPDPQWMHIVELDAEPTSGMRYPTLMEGELASLGALSDPRRHDGHHHEVSFDVVDGHEGCLRRPGTFWACYVVQSDDVETVERESSTWQSGIEGHLFRVPRQVPIEAGLVLRILREHLGMRDVRRVRGPDSLVLK